MSAKLIDFELIQLQQVDQLLRKEIDLLNSQREKYEEKMIFMSTGIQTRFDNLTQFRVQLLLAISELKNEQTINSN